MFAYPFQLLKLAQIKGEGFGTLELRDEIEPPIGSIVPLQIYTLGYHSLFYVTAVNGRTVEFKADVIQIHDPHALSSMISDGMWFNQQTTSEHDLKVVQACNQFVNELQRAEKKFPQWNKDPVHAAAILGEESGETLQAAMDYSLSPTDDADLRKKIMGEAVQTGAMAIRLLINADMFEHSSKTLSGEQTQLLRDMLAQDVPAEKVIAMLRQIFSRMENPEC